MRRTLIKLLVATTLLVFLLLLCFTGIDPALKVVIGAVLVVVVGPSVLLWGIDLSRAIKREGATSSSMRAAGRVLAIPQILFGVILTAWGVAYPAVFGIRDILGNASRGAGVLTPLVFTVTSSGMFLVGINYVRDGLSLLRYPTSRGSSEE